MKLKSMIYVSMLVLAILSVSALAFSQEATVKEAPAAPAVSPAEDPSKEIAIYGEVQSVNAASNSVSVQYYDYDSDEEKTVEVLANTDTKIENAAALANIKQGDWVDVTYTVSDAKNIAKSIIVEKEEEVPAEEVTTEKPETTKELPEEE